MARRFHQLPHENEVGCYKRSVWPAINGGTIQLATRYDSSGHAMKRIIAMTDEKGGRAELALPQAVMDKLVKELTEEFKWQRSGLNKAKT